MNKDTVQLTPRELQIIKMICAEVPQKLIAAELKITDRTVQNIQAGIRKKIGVATTIGIVIYAQKNKLLSL